MGAVLLTGATGFVGMELLARYLERSDRQVYALVRAPDDEAAAARVRTTLASLYGSEDAHPGRVIAIAADIEHEGLGLTPESRAQLAERVSDIVHAAASVSFSLPLEESRRVNVVGTRGMLELAHEAERRGGLTRFGHVSTAYVAGTHAGEFLEDQLDVGQGFRNGYEQSKYEAESLVRQAAERLPVQIFRPSIVVGEQDSGWTASFNVLYEPMKAFARGALPLLPARRSAPVDIVPVDFVADAIYTLATGPVDGRAETFHLVAGRHATTVGRLAVLGARYFSRREPRVIPPLVYRRLLHPLLMRGLPERKRRALARSAVYFPYFTMRVAFDDRRARERLEPHGIRVAPLESYLDPLVDFAVAANFGRRAISRFDRRG